MSKEVKVGIDERLITFLKDHGYCAWLPKHKNYYHSPYWFTIEHGEWVVVRENDLPDEVKEMVAQFPKIDRPFHKNNLEEDEKV